MVVGDVCLRPTKRVHCQISDQHTDVILERKVACASITQKRAVEGVVEEIIALDV